MNDEPNDDRVIVRLRSALDEVAAGVDDDDGLIPLHPRRELPRRWLGIAAAIALLAGGAGFAISRRTADDPAAEPPPASATADTATIPSPTASTVAEALAPPWFHLDMPGFVPGEIVERAPDPGDDPMLLQSWSVSQLDVTGFLTVIIQDAESARVVGDYTVEDLTPPEGTAVFLRPNLEGAPSDHGFELRWFRNDGSAWAFRSQGLDRDQLIQLAFAAVPGSGLPVVIGSPGVTSLAAGVVTDAATIQDYENETGLVRLWTENFGCGIQELISAANVVPVTVAGQPGYAAQLDDNRIEVAWNAGGGWWGHLSIAPELSRGADGIIAAVVPAAREK